MKRKADPREEILDHLNLYKDMGVKRIPVKTRSSGPPRPTKAPSAAAAKTSAPPAVPPASQAGVRTIVPRMSMFDEFPAGAESLDQIRENLGDCTRCKLAPSRRNIVFGTGNPKAELMFVGEAPGADEDEQGLPFVGRAGQLLTKIIEAIDLTRKDVYICNILKCRPPGNRNPEQDEIASCEPFLFRQIAAVNPKVICALGTFGAQTLLGTREPISRLRGQFIDFRGAKLLATFHPAYLLRNPGEKRKVWEDVRKISAYLNALRER